MRLMTCTNGNGNGEGQRGKGSRLSVRGSVKLGGRGGGVRQRRALRSKSLARSARCRYTAAASIAAVAADGRNAPPPAGHALVSV